MHFINGTETVMEYLDEIAGTSSIEAEPVRHGRWITSEKSDNDFVMYCPNCGAKMDGGIPDETVHNKK